MAGRRKDEVHRQEDVSVGTAFEKSNLRKAVLIIS